MPLPPGSRFERRNGNELVYLVPSDEAAAALLKELIGAGLPRGGAVPGEGRLERLSTKPPAAARPGPRGPGPRRHPRPGGAA